MAEGMEAVAGGVANTTAEGAPPMEHVLTSVARGDFSALRSVVPDESRLMQTGMYAVVAILMLVVAYFTAKILSRWIRTALCKRVDETLGKFAGRFVFTRCFAVLRWAF